MFYDAKNEIEYNDNIINKLFIGYYYTMYDCLQSEKKTYSFQTESFILFELEKIQQYYSRNNLSLDLLFKYYTRKQENSSFYCHYCKKTHIGKAFEIIYRPPKILVIILDRGHGKTFKGNIDIKKSLNLEPFIAEKNYEYSTKYELICVSSHRGESSSSGHYTASCLGDNHKYYYFSDTKVYEINEDNFISDEPYLLFYLRNDINTETFTYNSNENIEFKEVNKKIDKIVYGQININKLLPKNNIQTIISKNSLNNLNEFYNFSNIQKKGYIQKINKEKEKITNARNICDKEFLSNKECIEIKDALNKFISNYNEKKFSIDYYNSNKNPYIWKLVIKSPVDSPYAGKFFEFKLDFNFGFKKVIEHITIINIDYNLNYYL